jgi:hypothetical protein
MLLLALMMGAVNCPVPLLNVKFVVPPTMAELPPLV